MGKIKRRQIKCERCQGKGKVLDPDVAAQIFAAYRKQKGVSLRRVGAHLDGGASPTNLHDLENRRRGKVSLDERRLDALLEACDAAAEEKERERRQRTALRSGS